MGDGGAERCDESDSESSTQSACHPEKDTTEYTYFMEAFCADPKLNKD